MGDTFNTWENTFLPETPQRIANWRSHVSPPGEYDWHDRTMAPREDFDPANFINGRPIPLDSISPLLTRSNLRGMTSEAGGILPSTKASDESVDYTAKATAGRNATKLESLARKFANLVPKRFLLACNEAFCTLVSRRYRRVKAQMAGCEDPRHPACNCDPTSELKDLRIYKGPTLDTRTARSQPIQTQVQRGMPPVHSSWPNIGEVSNPDVNQPVNDPLARRSSWIEREMPMWGWKAWLPHRSVRDLPRGLQSSAKRQHDRFTSDDTSRTLSS